MTSSGLTVVIGDGVPFAIPDTHLDYLGMGISLCAGINLEGIGEELSTCAEVIAEITPENLHTYSTLPLPVVDGNSSGEIIRLDQELSLAVRNTCHFYQRTAASLDHSSKLDKELCISIPSWKL